MAVNLNVYTTKKMVSGQVQWLAHTILNHPGRRDWEISVPGQSRQKVQNTPSQPAKAGSRLAQAKYKTLSQKYPEQNGWRCGTSGRVLTKQVQGPEFNPQIPQKKKR
jgi:hypothetical protein